MRASSAALPLLALLCRPLDAAKLALDDAACSFSLSTNRCEPAASCAFRFRFGDLSLSQACRVSLDVVGAQPQQLHLAFAGDEPGSAMTLSWATLVQVEQPKVWLAEADAELQEVDADQLSLVVDAYISQEDDAADALYSYHATVSGLQPHTEYQYQVGSETARSNVSTFVTARAADDDDETFEVLVYGDFGADANAEATRAYLGNLTRSIDFIWHIGDVSYADNAWLSLSTALGDFYEELYNQWMNGIATVLAKIPYMVLVGNHEAECHSPSCFFAPASVQKRWGNYSAFNSRFRMPSTESGGAKNMWYSFDHGPAHFVSLSTETDFEGAPRNSFLDTTEVYGGFGNQLSWLEADLKAARSNDDTPWLIVGMHRAMYTLWSSETNGTPTGTPLALQTAFEELFIKYEVDVVLAGHVHAYERQFPIARGKKVADGVSADGKLYASPQAPVYLVTGAAGNSEGHDAEVNSTSVPWNAVRDGSHYGISSLLINSSALAFSLIGTESGDVLDAFTITK